MPLQHISTQTSLEWLSLSPGLGRVGSGRVLLGLQNVISLQWNAGDKAGIHFLLAMTLSIRLRVVPKFPQG